MAWQSDDNGSEVARQREWVSTLLRESTVVATSPSRLGQGGLRPCPSMIRLSGAAPRCEASDADPHALSRWFLLPRQAAARQSIRHCGQAGQSLPCGGPRSCGGLARTRVPASRMQGTAAALGVRDRSYLGAPVAESASNKLVAYKQPVSRSASRRPPCPTRKDDSIRITALVPKAPPLESTRSIHRSPPEPPRTDSAGNGDAPSCWPAWP